MARGPDRTHLNETNGRKAGPLPQAHVRAHTIVPVKGYNFTDWAKAELVTFSGLMDGREHIALVFKGYDISHLVRIHSECLTGDVFMSARCDCGPQLHESLSLLSEQGGVLLYLRQEGRGIGLYNKIDAYILQDSGLDTYAANEALRLRRDERRYDVAVQMLLALGLRRVRLITNNGDKVRQVRAGGIEIEDTVRTGTHVNEVNRPYLTAKAILAGHLLDIAGQPARVTDGETQ